MKRWLAMLAAVVKKELRQTFRDKRMMALLIAAPIVQLIVLGHAVNLEVDNVPTVVVDADQSHLSRTHLRRLLADGTLHEVPLHAIDGVDDIEAAERMLETSEAAAVIVVPAGFGRDLRRGRPATVQAILDGSDPNRSGVAGATVARYFAAVGDALVRSRVHRIASLNNTAPRAPNVEVSTRVFFNPSLNTAIYMVPGVVAMLLLLITTIVTAMGLSREKEVGTLEQIMVTPVPSGVLILGKILPFAAFGLFDFVLALVVGSTVFDMPLRGDFVVLFTATLLYLMTTLGMGLLISTLSNSQQQAFMGGFLFMLPAALLSGILTPIRSMPQWMQPLTEINPLRHYAEVLRGTLLRGAGADQLQKQLVVLALMGIVVFTFATLRFRKSLA